MAECLLPKQKVGGSNPLSRSNVSFTPAREPDNSLACVTPHTGLIPLVGAGFKPALPSREPAHLQGNLARNGARANWTDCVDTYRIMPGNGQWVRTNLLWARRRRV